MKLYLSERPSLLASACAQVPTQSPQAHRDLVGRWAVSGAELMQQQSVELQEAKARIQGTNGFTAKPGTAKSPVGAGADASGVPPRGRPV
jgi:hypothetical protein